MVGLLLLIFMIEVLKKMVRSRGFEPPHPRAQRPQRCVSTVSPRPHFVVFEKKLLGALQAVRLFRKS